MLTRRIVGITGISLLAGLIVVAVIWGFKGRTGGVEPAEKTTNESGTETTSIETLAKDLVGALASGDSKKAVENFDGTMKNALPAEKLQEAWNSIIAQSGPFVEQAGTRREKILLYDVIFVTCKFERGVLDAKVVFDRKQQIAGLFFVPSQGSAK
jgi:hypothetical protein